MPVSSAEERLLLFARVGLAAVGLTSAAGVLFAQGMPDRYPCEVKSEYQKATQALAAPLAPKPLKPSAELLALQAKQKQAQIALDKAKTAKDADESALQAAEQELEAFQKNPAQGPALEAIGKLRQEVNNALLALLKVSPVDITQLVVWQSKNVDPKLAELNKMVPDVPESEIETKVKDPNFTQFGHPDLVELNRNRAFLANYGKKLDKAGTVTVRDGLGDPQVAVAERKIAELAPLERRLIAESRQKAEVLLDAYTETKAVYESKTRALYGEQADAVEKLPAKQEELERLAASEEQLKLSKKRVEDGVKAAKLKLEGGTTSEGRVVAGSRAGLVKAQKDLAEMETKVADKEAAEITAASIAAQEAAQKLRDTFLEVELDRKSRLDQAVLEADVANWRTRLGNVAVGTENRQLLDQITDLVTAKDKEGPNKGRYTLAAVRTAHDQFVSRVRHRELTVEEAKQDWRRFVRERITTAYYRNRNQREVKRLTLIKRRLDPYACVVGGAFDGVAEFRTRLDETIAEISSAEKLP